MREKKGFTLIEVLAAIILISILALIAIPTTNKIIASARKKGFEQDANGLLKIVKLDRANSGLIGIDELSKYIISSANNTIYYNNNPIQSDFSGTIKGDGEIYVDSDGRTSMVYSNNGYCAYKNFEDKNITIVEGPCSRIENNNCSSGDFIFNIGLKNTWAQKKIVNISSVNISNYEIGYTLEEDPLEEDWITGTSVIMSSNGTLRAREKNEENTCLSEVQEINKIDNTSPTVSFSTVGNPTSIKVIANGKDEQSNIYGYKFSNDDGLTWTDIQTSNIYTFNNLSRQAYDIKVKAYNYAYYNTDENLRDELTGSGVSTTSSVTPPACPTPIITVSDSGVWTQRKTVTIDYGNSSECTGTYSIDGGTTWNEGNTFTLTANTTVTARNSNGIDSPVTNNFDVTKIDNSAPSLSLVIDKTSSSITVEAIASGASGIYSYEFSKDGGAHYTAPQAFYTYTFDGLTTNTYSIKVRAINNAYHNTDNSVSILENGKAEASESVTLDGCSNPTFAVSPTGDVWANRKVVTISSSSDASFRIQYTQVLSPTENDWIDGDEVEFLENGFVYARLTDGYNTCQTPNSQNVVKIEREAPTITSIEAVATGTDITIDTVFADTGGSGVAAPTCVYGTDNTYGSNCTSASTSQSTITGLTANETYYYKVCPVDNAGNIGTCYEGTIETEQLDAEHVDITSESTSEDNMQGLLEELYQKLSTV